MLKRFKLFFISYIMLITIGLLISSAQVFAIRVTELYENAEGKYPYKIQFEINPVNPRREWGQGDLYYEILGSKDITYNRCCCFPTIVKNKDVNFIPDKDPRDKTEWTLQLLRQRLFHGFDQVCEADWELGLKIYYEGDPKDIPSGGCWIKLNSRDYPLSILWDEKYCVNVRQRQVYHFPSNR